MRNEGTFHHSGYIILTNRRQTTAGTTHHRCAVPLPIPAKLKQGCKASHHRNLFIIATQFRNFAFCILNFAFKKSPKKLGDFPLFYTIKVIWCCLVNKVVKPVGIKQICMSAPCDIGVFAVIVVGEIVFRHVNGKTKVFIAYILV